MSNGHLIGLENMSVARRNRNDGKLVTHHLLNFHLLEWTESTGSGLHVQCAPDTVLQTLGFVSAIGEWRKGFVGDILEGFRAAHLASIRVDLKKWLDLRDTGDNPSDGNQSSNRGPSDFSDS